MPDRKFKAFEQRNHINKYQLEADITRLEEGMQHHYPLATLHRIFPERFYRLISTY